MVAWVRVWQWKSEKVGTYVPVKIELIGLLMDWEKVLSKEGKQGWFLGVMDSWVNGGVVSWVEEVKRFCGEEEVDFTSGHDKFEICETFKWRY